MSTETNPFDIPVADTPAERIAYLWKKFDQHRSDDRKAILSEEELLVVAELLDELNGRANPGPGADTDDWGRLARQASMRIYDRLGI